MTLQQRAAETDSDGRDHEMDEEMRHHLALLVEENLAAGMSPEEARRAAHLRFGHAESLQEEARAARPRA